MVREQLLPTLFTWGGNSNSFINFFHPQEPFNSFFSIINYCLGAGLNNLIYIYGLTFKSKNHDILMKNR